MAYGLVAYTGNNTLLIDGESSYYESLQIVSEGTSSSVTLDQTKGDLLFVTRNATGLVSGNIDSQGGTLIGHSNWFICRPASNFSEITSGYGLKVFNQSGDISYQSHASSTGVAIKNMWPAYTLNGMRSGWTARVNDSSGDFLLSGTSPSGYYVGMTSAFEIDQNDSVTIINGAYFSYGSNFISFTNYFDTGGSGGNTSLSAALDNPTPILLARKLN